MLLEMLSSLPDGLVDFLAWQPLSYREPFAASRFKGAADPNLRGCLDALAGSMTAMLEAARAALRSRDKRGPGSIEDGRRFFR
jgi:hypothetical protein